ncbi:MAG: hypothetical protein LUB83_04335 [Prevotellaceae bacterium]|nr:hypothetical protein [Prevotellaceae bacterium]
MDNNKLVELFVTPIRECVNYKPHFGDSSSKGYSIQDFLDLYGRDPFYSWIGLNTPYMYTAHKAAGSMTSIYRQIGIGCERIFRQIIFEQAKYDDYSYSQWGYTTKTKAGKDKYLALDGRIELNEIKNPNVKSKAEQWIYDLMSKLEVNIRQLNGAVFEVRQGYKSKDSKRQNGDLDNAAVAYSYNYLPVFMIFSSQIDKDIELRYRNGKCGVLVGNLEGDALSSLFKFCDEVLMFDLAYFFERNSSEIKQVVNNVLKTLFSVDETAK